MSADIQLGILFPTVFPTACDVVVLNHDQSVPDPERPDYVTNITRTGFTAHIAGTRPNNRTFYWLALGH
jgi:hypothetical protein